MNDVNMYNPFSLNGKTVLITGASSGIGRTTAIECSKIGAKLNIVSRNEERLLECFSKLEGAGHQMIRADLTSMEDIERLVASVPPLDGVVNNAGIAKILPVQFVNEVDLNEIYKTNTLGAVFLSRNLYKKKKINKNGSIVFNVSIAGTALFSSGNAMYGMSKAAIQTFMKYAAVEFAGRGIRCNSVNPGMIETPLINEDSLTTEDYEKDRAKYLLKRYGKPEDVAYAIIYLLSDASSWTTGTSLVVDGGRLLYT